MQIPAGQFKARCLKLMRDVQKFHEEIVITKFGKPIAKLTPIEERAPAPLFGFMRADVVITGDIASPTEERWEADGPTSG